MGDQSKEAPGTGTHRDPDPEDLKGWEHLRAAQAGDDAELLDFFAYASKRVEPMVKYLERRNKALVRRVGHDDYLQTVLYCLRRRYSRCKARTPGKMLSWMYQVAKRIIADIRKHHVCVKRDIRCEESGRIELGASRAEVNDREPSTGESSVPSKVANLEIQEAFWRGWAELDERDRRVFTLRWLDELKWAEVGDRMGLSANAAEKLFERAKERFRRRHGSGTVIMRALDLRNRD